MEYNPIQVPRIMPLGSGKHMRRVSFRRRSGISPTVSARVNAEASKMQRAVIKARIDSLNRAERKLLYDFIMSIRPKRSPLKTKEFAIMYIGMGIRPTSMLGSSRRELEALAAKQKIDLNSLTTELKEILDKISPHSQPD